MSMTPDPSDEFHSESKRESEVTHHLMTPEQSEEDFSNNEEQTRQSELAKVSRAAYDIASSFDARSRLETCPMPVIPDKNVVVGQLLGVGGFSEVISVAVNKPCSPERKIVCAMKRLLPSVIQSSDLFYGAALDLVLEAKILSRLNHPNIIKLHGVSCDDVSLKSCYLGGNRYCLYLDVFYVTVRDRFDEWRKQHNFPHTNKESLHHRLETIALPIANAMEYLHYHNIIFRDLKPENMGVDVEGTVKLFDFGLARETNPSHRMTSISGSRTYMAPEVAQSKPYGLSADVYSFGVFLFECCTLSKRKGHNFPVYSATSRTLKKLIKQCRSKSALSRPSFGEIVDQLQSELHVMREVKSEGDLRRFSIPRWSHTHVALDDLSR